MYIEMHSGGKKIKNWHIPYQFGPYPMDGEMIEIKELQLAFKVMECKVDAGPLVYSQPYEMYLVVRSEMRPSMISDEEYNDFLISVAKRKIKRTALANKKQLSYG